jgi:Fe-S cluster assembly protein SufD
MVTQISKPDTFYYEAFQEFQAKTGPAAASWLDRLRENAMDRFQEVGFPSVKEEEWKYTNVAPLVKTKFNPTSFEGGTLSDLTAFAYGEAAESQLVFVNGILRPDLSSLSALSEGVVAIDLAQAVLDQKYGEVLRQRLARGADYVVNGFVALNTAFLSTGAFLYVPSDLKVSRPLHLLFIADAANANAAIFPRVLVVAEENSSVTLIESYASTGDDVYFTNAVVELVLGENSNVEHYKVQRESSEAFHIATTTAALGRNSRYDTTSITLGAQLSRHDISVIMDEEGAECSVDGLYLVSNQQHTDTHSVIDHRKANCTSHQLYKGILDGKSRAVFNGKIFVRHDAQKTDAMQTNKNLLLSNEARVDTKPQLEILADDVKCAHGAAVGQIDEEELFYLETRGIHHDLARNLLTYGFAEEVIAKIAIDSIRAQLDEAVLNRLNARLEA